MLEQVLGASSSRLVFGWGLLDGFVAADIAFQICEHPNVWIDGSLVLDESLVSPPRVLGSFLTFLGTGGVLVGGDHLDDFGPVGGVVELCRGFLLCALVLYRLFREQSFGGLLLPCRLPRLFTWWLIT